MAGAVNCLTGSTFLPGFVGREICLNEASVQKRGSVRLQPQAMRRQQSKSHHKMPTAVQVSAADRNVRSRGNTQVSTVRQEESMSTPIFSDVGAGLTMADRIRAIEAEIARMKLEVAIQDEAVIGVEQEVIEQQEKAMDLFRENQEAQTTPAAPARHPYAHLQVSERWEEIQGSENWDGLLDPMDPVLRGEMMRYGEFAQATYDAFDSDSHSRFCGSCKYNKKHLLEKIGLKNRGYEVTDYLYGTCGDNPMASFFQRFDADHKDDEKAWSRESNWMGFVAVATDPEEIARLGRRDIVVVWRGTVTKLEWLENLRDYLAPSELDRRNAGETPMNITDLKVEAGFLAVYKTKNEKSPYTKKSARQQVLEAVKRLVQKYGQEENLSITVTGHSLGSALAKLSAYDIAESRINHRTKVHCRKHVIPEQWGEDHELSDEDSGYSSSDSEEEEMGDIPITVYSFGGPRVGNDAFRDRVEQLGIRVLRVVNENDRVTKLPGVLINEKWQFLEKNLKPFWNWLETLPWTYSHIGVEFKLNNLNSPFLRRTKDPWNAHNLEAYLHLLNGFHGSNLPFSPALPRDLALVNKGTNLLTPNHYIPPTWWQEENKGLVLTEDGHYVVRSRDIEDFPEYDLDLDEDMENCEFQ
ncbi:phospholipase A1 [Marchantia polymorpha subsp. ruderalis]|uniref:Fungal lipase-type domain-containing protein n=1 Tax=Marchantia polymorpha TaxID=3197 RepID=A0A2R6WKA2_MARPO|nr:hypothetical protein MARPO_0081s0016 [Marchantia polymorpha]BBN18747.1 hypothetical protein Mp_8g05150 [Marchantia polymorpha subsp. ruderalis]|eukprot:PTQ34286.1 hypothetical protein MARPO_0081s0016 [Marchantia polymorpha]